jgi:hypothetical protein
MVSNAFEMLSPTQLLLRFVAFPLRELQWMMEGNPNNPGGKVQCTLLWEIVAELALSDGSGKNRQRH